MAREVRPVSVWEVAGMALVSYVAVMLVGGGLFVARYWWEERTGTGPQPKQPLQLPELEDLLPCPECGVPSAAVSVGFRLCDACHQAEHGG